MASTVALIMAAGASRRFNGIKQLAMLEGQPMIQMVLQPWQRLVDISCHVCLGAYEDKIRPHLPNNVNYIAVPNWTEGIGHNIGYGVTWLNQPKANIFLGLGDQVGITSSHLMAMLEMAANHPNKIIATEYANTFGAPVLFPAHFQQELKQLSGDQGAKSILHNYRDQIICVTCDDGKYDIDTLLDLERWNQLNTSQTT
jgi:molybdenum cofactor cytidylyltransferase